MSDDSQLVLDSLHITAEICVGFSITDPGYVTCIFEAVERYLLATAPADDAERKKLYDTLGLDDA